MMELTLRQGHKREQSEQTWIDDSWRGASGGATMLTGLPEDDWATVRGFESDILHRPAALSLEHLRRWRSSVLYQ
jgi:hypothetical protein